MLNIIEVLGVSKGTAGIIYAYLTGAAWWTWLVDAGFLVAGIVTGGIAALIKMAVKRGLKRAVKRLSKRKAIAL